MKTITTDEIQKNSHLHNGKIWVEYTDIKKELTEIENFMAVLCNGNNNKDIQRGELWSLWCPKTHHLFQTFNINGVFRKIETEKVESQDE